MISACDYSHARFVLFGFFNSMLDAVLNILDAFLKYNGLNGDRSGRSQFDLVDYTCDDRLRFHYISFSELKFFSHISDLIVANKIFLQRPLRRKIGLNRISHTARTEHLLRRAPHRSSAYLHLNNPGTETRETG